MLTVEQADEGFMVGYQGEVMAKKIGMLDAVYTCQALFLHLSIVPFCWSQCMGCKSNGLLQSIFKTVSEDCSYPIGRGIT